MVWSGALLTCCLPYDTHDLTAQDPEAAVRTLSPLTSTGRRATRALLSAPACEYDRLWRGATLHTTAISIRALARTDENIAGLGLHEYVVLGDERVRNFADEARDPEEDPNEDYDPDQEEDDDAEIARDNECKQRKETPKGTVPCLLVVRRKYLYALTDKDTLDVACKRA